MVAGVFLIVGVEQLIARTDDEGRTKLAGSPARPTLAVPILDRAQSRSDCRRFQERGCSHRAGADDFGGGSVLVQQHGVWKRLLGNERFRIASTSRPDGNDGYLCEIEILLPFPNLTGSFTTGQSAEMAQEQQHRGTLCPQITESMLTTVGIHQDVLSECRYIEGLDVVIGLHTSIRARRPQGLSLMTPSGRLLVAPRQGSLICSLRSPIHSLGTGKLDRQPRNIQVERVKRSTYWAQVSIVPTSAPVGLEEANMTDYRDPALAEQPVDVPSQDLPGMAPPPMLTADMLPKPGPDRTEINRRVGKSIGQLLLLGSGIMLLVFGGLLLSQTGFEFGADAESGSVAGLHGTSLMAVIQLVLGLILVSAGAQSRLDWGTARLLGGITLAFGVVLLAEPAALQSWLGARAASGWLFVVLGSVMLIAAVVHPLMLGDEGEQIS